jgi:hypothetical protein
MEAVLSMVVSGWVYYCVCVGLEVVSAMVTLLCIVSPHKQVTAQNGSTSRTRHIAVIIVFIGL